MPTKRLWVLLATALCSLAVSVADAKSKRTKTDWDDDADKELPPLVVHGYFRFRGDLFHNFDLGYRPFQFGKLTSYFTPFSERNPNRDIAGLDPSRALATANGAETLGTASIRFRLEPTINVTEDVRIKAQIDIFDNLVLGSTPDGFPNPSPLVPIIGFTGGAVPPSDGANSLRDSIRVKRAWGEVMTPFGLLAFGRMPNHWGMGLLANDGSCLDCDYGDTYDRVMFVTKIAGHYIVPILDFASEGLTSDVAEMINVYRRGSAGLGGVPVIDRYLGRPFDLDQRDDVNQYALAIAKRDSPKEIKEKLENGETVINYGLFVVRRVQAWTTENRAYATFGNAYQGRLDTPDLFRQPLFERRAASAWILDPWFKLIRNKLEIEFEAAVILGEIGESVDGEKVDVRQFGATLRISHKFLHDTLTFAFEAGIASGTDGVGLGVRDTAVVAPPPPFDPRTGLRVGSPRATNFKFDPDFLVDRILWREIVGTVTDAWYVKPSIQYNVTEGFGIKLATIYSAAVNTRQWPGQSTPIGFEFNFDIFYQSEEFLYAALGYAGLAPFSALKDPTIPGDPTYAQAIYTRLIIRY
jgi:uncharacterized protein (TIGR04551 family)